MEIYLFSALNFACHLLINVIQNLWKRMSFQSSFWMHNIWKKLDHEWNTLYLSSQSGLTMVVGGEDGVIRLYELSPSGVPVSNTPQVKIELINQCLTNKF